METPRAVELMKRRGSQGSYTLFAHPKVFDELVRTLTPKEAWKLAYREARMHLKKMTAVIYRVGEIGRVDNIRFIEAA